jgi:hypothetical protein
MVTHASEMADQGRFPDYFDGTKGYCWRDYVSHCSSHSILSLTALFRTMLLSGFVYYLIVVNLPIRFQIASGDSPIMAGVRLLPLLVSSGIGSMVGGMVSRKRNNTAYGLIASSAFQLLGYGLMTTLGNNGSVPAKQYGFQVCIGIGFGLSMASSTHMMTLQLQREPQWMGKGSEQLI